MAGETKVFRKFWGSLPIGHADSVSSLLTKAKLPTTHPTQGTIRKFLKKCVESGFADTLEGKSLRGGQVLHYRKISNEVPPEKKTREEILVGAMKILDERRSKEMQEKIEESWKQLELGGSFSVRELLGFSKLPVNETTKQHGYRFMKRAVRQGIAETVVREKDVAYKKIKDRVPVFGQKGTYSLNKKEEAKADTNLPLPPKTLTTDMFTKHVIDEIVKSRERIKELEKALQKEIEEHAGTRQKLIEACEDCKQATARNRKLQEDVNDLRMAQPTTVRDILKKSTVIPVKTVEEVLKEASNRG